MYMLRNDGIIVSDSRPGRYISVSEEYYRYYTFEKEQYRDHETQIVLHPRN